MKKQLLTRVIDHCNDCPYRVSFGGNDYCKFLHGKEIVLYDKNFPNFCPLEDYNEKNNRI